MLQAARVAFWWMVGQLCSVAAVADQQIVLIPLFLKYWTGDTLSAWLTILLPATSFWPPTPGCMPLHSIDFSRSSHGPTAIVAALASPLMNMTLRQKNRGGNFAMGRPWIITKRLQ